MAAYKFEVFEILYPVLEYPVQNQELQNYDHIGRRIPVSIGIVWE